MIMKTFKMLVLLAVVFSLQTEAKACENGQRCSKYPGCRKKRVFTSGVDEPLGKAARTEVFPRLIELRRMEAYRAQNSQEKWDQVLSLPNYTDLDRLHSEYTSNPGILNQWMEKWKSFENHRDAIASFILRGDFPPALKILHHLNRKRGDFAITVEDEAAAIIPTFEEELTSFCKPSEILTVLGKQMNLAEFFELFGFDDNPIWHYIIRHPDFTYSRQMDALRHRFIDIDSRHQIEITRLVLNHRERTDEDLIWIAHELGSRRANGYNVPKNVFSKENWKDLERAIQEGKIVQATKQHQEMDLKNIAFYLLESLFP